MRIPSLAALILIVGCGSNPERVKSPDSQETSPELEKLLDSAKTLVGLQRKAQPNSWNVTMEESLAKENPFTPPAFVLNSGVPPKPNSYPYDSGLWNCQRLKVGQSHCQDDARKHMIALHYPEDASSEGGGQVAAFGIRSTLVADCSESKGVVITINSPYILGANNKTNELGIGFDNTAITNYKITLVNESSAVIVDSKVLLAKLMEDFTSVEIQILTANNASRDGLQFVVKNFPKAWAVACGWYSEYDVVTGVG